MATSRNEGNMPLVLGISAWIVPMILPVAVILIFRFTRISLDSLASFLPSILTRLLPIVLGAACIFVGRKGLKSAKLNQESPSQTLVVSLTLGVLAVVYHIWNWVFAVASTYAVIR